MLLTVLLFRSECFCCSQSSLKVLKVSAEKHREKRPHFKSPRAAF
ncbi:hypothetical protein HMPREF9065_01456 [Aggregatibacter sp. oral taxon 458 str. W10330]|nr:hypothetical protein HMPREF9065_01456 [Aggregatibacter sp. oral taxon 458 str. W10330]